jgi:hypothetical protein
MRAKSSGVWGDPLSPEEVWRTAAHELAHLKHMDHGESFQEFELEMYGAMRNQQEDHREKLIRKIVKMQAQAEGERAIGNEEAANNFAEMINKMLIQHELSPTDLDFARVDREDPVIELWVDLDHWQVKRTRARIAWQEELARVVAKAHLCTFFLRRGSNSIAFVGTRSHASVAEYTYVTLVRAATKLSNDAWVKEWRSHGGKMIERGFRPSWLDGFIMRISERFEIARKAAVAEHEAARAAKLRPVAPGEESTALIRLNGAMTKVQKYVDDRFGGGRGRPASYIQGRRGGNSRGLAAGKAAADAMPIGQKSVAGGEQKRLK